MRHDRVYRTEGVVLRAIDFGETDRILTLYTPRHGKLRAIGKGVRRPGSRLGGHLDLLMRSRLLVARGRNLDIITQAETIEPFLGLRDDLWRTGQACQVAELLDRLTEDGHEDSATFDSLLLALRRIADDPDPELAVWAFEVALLDRLGYRPQLQTCLGCDQPLARVENRYSASAGGVLCPACAATDPMARPLSANALAFLRQLQAAEYGLLTRVRRSDALRTEVAGVLVRQVQYVLERELKSSALVSQLRAMA